MTGEPWGTARIPLPPKSLSQFLLLPPLSSSSFPSLLCSCTFAHSLKGVRQGRGAPTPAQLPAILLFWGGSSSYFSLSFSFLPSLSSLTQPLPLLSVLWLCVQQVLSTTERTERERERARRLSWKSCYFSSLFFPFLVHLFCVASIFHPLAWPGKHLLGRVLSGPLFSFIPLLLPRLLVALQWRASFHVCNSRPSRMRITAAARSSHSPVGCSS